MTALLALLVVAAFAYWLFRRRAHHRADTQRADLGPSADSVISDKSKTTMSQLEAVPDRPLLSQQEVGIGEDLTEETEANQAGGVESGAVPQIAPEQDNSTYPEVEAQVADDIR